MEDIKFLLDFSDSGSLEKIISGLEKVEGKYKDVQKSIEKAQKELLGTNDAKRITVLVAELDKLKREYSQLQTEVQKANATKQKNKQLTDEQIIAETRHKEAINKLRKETREQIKDENALQLAQKKSANSIKELREQTNALVRQRDKLDLSTKRGKQEFDSLTKRISDNTNKLKQYDEQIGRYQRNVGNYASAFKSVGGQLLGATGITLGVTGLVQGITSATDAFKEFDGQLQEVSAITGLTGQDLEFFKQQAFEVGTTTRTSANDYLNAVKIIGSAKPELLTNKEALDQVTRSAILLGEASGMELPAAATALTDAMNQFGASADQAGKFVDVLAAGAKFGSAEVPQVTEALLKFGAVANQSNVSLTESVGLIEALAEKGLKGAEAGTALRNVMLKLSAPDALPVEAQKRLSQLGISMEKLKDTSIPFSDRLKLLKPLLKDNATLVKVFGTENVVAATNLIKNTDRIKELTAQVNTNGVAMEQATANNKSAAAQSEILTNKMKTLAIQIGEKLTPIVNILKTAFNALLWIILKLIEGFEWVIEKVGQLADLMDGGLNKAIQEYNANLDLVKTKNGDLANSLEKSNASLEEQMNTTKLLADTYKVLGTATEKTQKEGEALFKEFAKGKMTVDELKKSLQDLYVREQMRRSKGAAALRAGIKVIQETQQTEEDIAKNREAAAKAAEDAYNKRLKMLEDEKKRKEIEAETTIKDEKKKNDALQKINIDFLGQKFDLDQRYNKDYLSTQLELIRAELANEKQKQDELKKLREEEIARARALSDLDFELMNDGLEKEIAAEYRALVEKIDNAQKAGILTQEIETRLAEQTEQKISEIRKKYRDQAVEDELKEYDEYYKELELQALKSGKSREEIDLVLRNAEIERLKDEIRIREEAGQDVLDLKIELARKELEIEQEKEDKLKDIIQKSVEFTKDSINIVTDAYQEAVERRIEQQERELEAQKNNVDRQVALAEAGQENTLAFEKALQAEKEKELLRTQKKAERAKKIEAFFNALAQYSKDEPNTAAAKAFLQVQLADLFASKFEDGGIVQDVVNRDGVGGKIVNGIFKGRRHKQGGILIEAEGEEGILSRNEMRNLGRDNFYALKSALNSPNSGIEFEKQNDSMSPYMAYYQQKIDFSPIQRELKEVKAAIQEKPVPSFNIDPLLNAIVTIQQQGKKQHRVYVPTKKRL